MLEGVQLIGEYAVVVVLFVHLQRVDPEDVLRGHGVAERTFGATGEVPRLFANPFRRFRVADRVGAVGPFRIQQLGVGLFVVPNVGVAEPNLCAVFVGPPHVLRARS